MIKFDKGFYFSLLGAILWAISIILSRFILAGKENVSSVLFWITCIGLPFWIFIFIKNRDDFKKLKNNDFLIIGGIILVSGIAQTIVDLFALKYDPAINYSFLIRLVVLFTFIFAAIFLNEKLTKGKILLAFVLIFGAFLLVTNGKVITMGVGDILTILDAALVSFGNTILGKMAAARMKPMLAASLAGIGGFLPKIVIALYMGQTVGVHNFWLLILLGFLGIAAISVRYTTYKYASASLITVMLSLTPVFVLIMAIPLLGESISTAQAIGGVLIIGASIFALKSKI
jgi:drug/metabolite transporter (DMT)-like permease